MIIKTDTFELEISDGTGVYFGSKTSGQLFRKWEGQESEIGGRKSGVRGRKSEDREGEGRRAEG
jgi:hypothetical protein